MLRLAEELVLLLKLLRLALFPVKHLGNLHTGEVLGKEGVNVGCSVLNTAICLTGELTEDDCEENDEGYEAKHHQGKQVVQAKHSHEHAHDDEAVLDKVNEKVGEHHRDCTGIVTYTGNKLTNGHRIKLTVRKALDMCEGILTKVGEYLLTDSLENKRLQIGCNQGKDKNACVYDNICRKVAHLKVAA